LATKTLYKRDCKSCATPRRREFSEEKQCEDRFRVDTACGPGTALVRSRPIWERAGAAIILEVAYDLGVALFSISTTHTIYAMVMADNLGP
jgi:hypothetical protein